MSIYFCIKIFESVLFLIEKRRRSKIKKIIKKEFFYEFLKLFRKQNKNFFRPPNVFKKPKEEKTLFFQVVPNSTPPSLSNFEMNEKYQKNNLKNVF